MWGSEQCSSAAAARLHININPSPSHFFGFLTSSAINRDGFGLINSWDNGGTLISTHCVNTDCSTAGHSQFEIAGTSPTPTSIAIGADGLGHQLSRPRTSAGGALRDLAVQQQRPRLDRTRH
jgi:hypothetical protein